MKVFRKIRLSLLENGNLKKYLTYAVGEILLIVVGILLAFQIGNWNEKRTNKQTEQSYYKNIKRQLEEDKALITFNIEYNNKYLSQFEHAVQLIDGEDRGQLDTLGVIALNLIRYSDFHRASNIYETIVNSGQIKLLQNSEIIERLQRLEELYVYINKMEDIHLDVIKQTVLPELMSTIDFSARTLEEHDLIYTFEFKNRFILLLEIMKEKREVYDRATSEIGAIVGLIDQELNGREQ